MGFMKFALRGPDLKMCLGIWEGVGVLSKKQTLGRTRHINIHETYSEEGEIRNVPSLNHCK